MDVSTSSLAPVMALHIERFSSISWYIDSSMVFLPRKYVHCTESVCPILCALSSHCSQSAGCQGSSMNATREDAVRVRPTPAAFIEQMITFLESSFWNDSTACCLSAVLSPPKTVKA